MKAFTLDIRGMVNNTKLSDSKYLWPLFEAVVNSIQSIEDAGIDDGVIKILAERSNYEQFMLSTNSDTPVVALPSIDTFHITDNGIGFSADNYESFCTANSTLKIKRGCKGIGRFIWLKAFDKVHIDSTFLESGNCQKRSFDFTLDGTSPDENLTSTDFQERSTTVSLTDYKNPYRDKCDKTLETIAHKIVEHCLVYFVLDKAPRIILSDNIGTDSIVLNNYYRDNIRDTLHQDHFEIDSNNFALYHIKVPQGVSSHELHFCANDREVKSYTLGSYLPNLQKKIRNGVEGDFFYCGYLTSSYLDTIVDSSRTDFEFVDDVDLLHNVPEKELVEAAKPYIAAYLQDYIEAIDERKKKQVQNFVAHKQPQYKFLIAQRPQVIDAIKPDLSPEALDNALYQQVILWDSELREQGNAIQQDVAEKGIPLSSIMSKFTDYYKGLDEINKINLAQYVTRRKVILELLENALECDENGHYVNEEQLHTIICPMRYASDELAFDEMNLWIIDERLAYHTFLASDKQLREIPILDSDSVDRPDIAIFDEAFAFGGQNEPFDSITIVEFKKPNRSGLNRDNTNPVNQVMEYAEKIRQGKAKRAKGKQFGNADRTAFFCYVIADQTDSMHKAAKLAGLRPTPDGDGYYGYNSGYEVYVEVIFYNKLIREARKRNQVLFDKLFKPSPREIIDPTAEVETQNEDEVESSQC